MTKRVGGSWLTWAFAAEELAKGALQAIGGIVVWVALIYYIASSDWGSALLRKALGTKAPTLSAIADAPPAPHLAQPV
jgi:hypothetical protein